MAAVGRDEQGNPTVELKPFALSKSEQAFNQGATQGFLSQYQMSAQRGLQEIAAKHQSDPAAFDRESRDYVRGLGAGAKDLRPLVQAEGEKIRQQHFLSISNAAVQRQTAQAKDSILVQIQNTENEMYALSRQGGVTTPEYGAAEGRLSGLYDQLKGNPLFGVAQERADSERQATKDRALGFAMSAEAVRIYEGQGDKAAQKWLVDKIQNNPDLKIDDAKRSGLLETGRNAIAMRKGENAQAVAANKASAGVLAKAMESGKSLPQGAVEQAIDTATRLGDIETAAKLLTSKQVYAQSQTTRGMTDEQKVAFYTGGGAGAAPTAPSDIHGVITSAADQYGISHNYALRVAHIESRFDPNAMHPGSRATGLFQFIPSTWQSYGQGQSARDPAANADAAMRFTVANRDQLRRSLGREPTEGELYLAHQQGAGGAAKLLASPNARAVDVVGERAVLANGGTIDMTAGSFAQKWIRKVDGATGAPPAAPVGRSPFTQEQMAANPYLASTWVRSQIAGNKDAIDAAKYVISAASNALDKGTLPEARSLAEAIQIANQNPGELGRARDELIAKVKGFEAGEEANSAGGGAGERLVQDAMRQAQGAPIFVQRQAEAIKESVERGAKNLKDQPWDEAARRGWAQFAPLPLDPSSSQAFAAGLQARSDIATAITARSGLAQSVLSSEDVQAVGRTFRTGSPEERSVVANELARLPDEQISMIAADKEMKDSLVAMTRSGDPSKMATGFSLMDRARRADPDGFHRSYGEAVENKLTDWMSRQAYLLPDQIAKEVAKDNDPATREARELVRKEGLKKVEKLTPDQIAGEFDLGLLSIAPGAPIQTDRSEALAFAAEYRQRFSETLPEVGGNEAKAKELTVERMGREWGASVLTGRGSLGGGRLMKFPPEKSPAYPTIGGSHDWLVKQFDDAVRTAVAEMGGRAFNIEGPGDLDNPAWVESPTARTILNAPRALVSDRQTEAEFRAGKPPSYPVVIMDPKTGMYTPLQNARGKPVRFFGDPEPVLAERRAKAMETFEGNQEAFASQERFEAETARRAARRREQR
jgi:hypothetical protein